jgi:predicted dienelactone hydrolase
MGGSSTTTGSGGAAGGMTINGCSADDRKACTYTAAKTFEVEGPQTVSDKIKYTDKLGQERVVPVAIYRPKGATGKLPVIVLSHGGGGGKDNPVKSMDKWAPFLAEAGYVAIAVAHVGRNLLPGGDYEQLCTELGVPNAPAPFYCDVKLNWDRPHDIKAVLDWLIPQAETVGIDPTNIMHMGHSAGAGAAMMMSGVKRNFKCAQAFGDGQGSIVPCDVKDLVDLSEPRFKAVVAMSPQGPGTDGFMTESYASMQVPFFMGTGASDGDLDANDPSKNEPNNRMQAFDLAPEGDRWRVFIDHVGATHTFFEAEVKKCEETAGPEQCSIMQTWLRSGTLAFIDHRMRDSADALAWLKSANLKVMSSAVATLDGK